MPKIVTKTAASEIKKATREAAKKNIMLPDDFGDKEYTCIKCGTSTNIPEGKFYLSKWSKLWVKNGNRFPVCKECLNDIFQENVGRYGVRFAILIACYMMDIPFVNAAVDTIEKHANITIGSYTRCLNKVMMTQRTFTNSLLDGEVVQALERSESTEIVKWSDSDKKNMRFVINTYGYDPFPEADYGDGDRKMLHNMLAGYISDDEDMDPHKRISAVTMVKTILQRDRVDKLIDFELQSVVPSQNLKLYSDTKKKLEDIISDLANENGFSAKSAGKTARKANTLTSIMKRMLDEGYDFSKPNVIDSKMNGVYYEMAQISNQNLMDQLNFQSDDYARMVATQRDLLLKNDEKIMKLEEENRKLRILLRDTGNEKLLHEL